MAKKQIQDEPKEFTMQDLHHHRSRGLYHVLGIIEQQYLARNCKVCNGAWQWISGFWSNPRAKSMIEKHAPEFVPATAK